MPVTIHVYVGGPVGASGAEGHDLGRADRERPDVNRVVPGVGDRHGFDAEFSTGRSGTQTIYVYAVNLDGTAGGSTLLATTTLAVQDPSPLGHVDAVDSPEAAQLRVRGWGFDRNAVGTAIDIRVSVGGPAGTAGAEVHELGAASRPRTDVAQVFPGVGAGHGFDVSFTTNRTGAQGVYVYGINVAGTPGSNVLFDSQLVTVKAPDALFTALTPTRILDSRPAGPRVGPYTTPWGAGTARDVTVTGLAGVPTDATAVVLNATVTNASTTSHLTVWPAGTEKPIASNLNWSPGWTVANAATVKVGGGGKVSVYNAQGSVDVVLDVVGYYRSDDGAGFTAMTPIRVQDSRPAGPSVGPHRTPWEPTTTRDVQLAGVAGIPADADAVVVNATVTNTTAASYLTVWPTGQSRPLASSLNWDRDWTIPNAVTVKLGVGGAISVYNNAGRADVVLDVVGYFTRGAGHAFQPISPTRVQDSRAGATVGPYETPWSGGMARDVVVTTGPIPKYASGVVLAVAATNATAGSHLTVWPAGTARPLASSLNWMPGWTIANAVTAPVGTGGKVSVYNNAGSVDVVVDAAGWYG